MFEFLTTVALLVFALTVLSGAGVIILHVIFGPALSPSVQVVADTFMSVYKSGASVFIGAFRLLRQGNDTSNGGSGSAPTEAKSLPPVEPKQIAGP
jgi:hypothetical protein